MESYHTRTRQRLATRHQRIEAYEGANQQAARIIASDPRRYPGIMQSWAHAVLSGAERTERTWGLIA